jgi:hypothetical protein
MFESRAGGRAHKFRVVGTPPISTLDKAKIFGKLKRMSELGEIYRLSGQIVLQKYSLEKDEHGRSQFWKVAAIEEDRKASRDSRILQKFVKDIEQTVDKLTVKKSTIRKTSMMVSHSQQPHTVAAEPIAPASPHNPS